MSSLMLNPADGVAFMIKAATDVEHYMNGTDRYEIDHFSSVYAREDCNGRTSFTATGDAAPALLLLIWGRTSMRTAAGYPVWSKIL